MGSETVADRVREILDRIAAAEARAGRDSGEVTLCAVTKTFPATRVEEAAAAGATNVGENKVQEAEAKKPAVGNSEALRWHLIGHLQGNKARRAVELFDVIQTVDSVKLAERIDRLAGELGRAPTLLIQVDLASEPTKAGAREEEVAPIAAYLDRSRHVRLAGLMAIPPFFEDPERVRPYFRQLRALRDRINDSGMLARPLSELSMGMSHDFEVAVQEGATIVRVGSAIFGPRGGE
jgi:pyridoxal phosphate enzyme (YggS family)